MELYSVNNKLLEEECIDVYEHEQQRIKQLQDNPLTKQIQKLLQDKKELTSQLGNLSDQLETIKLEKKELSDQLETINLEKKELSDQLEIIEQDNEKFKTLYDETNILLQDNIIDENIYTPENGYTKDFGKETKHNIFKNIDSYIILNRDLSQKQQINGMYPQNIGEYLTIYINNYGEILIYSGTNNRYIDTIWLQKYTKKKFKGVSYILPDFIIKKINEFRVQYNDQLSALVIFISMCKMNAENYYKQLYYKELLKMRLIK